MILSDYINSKAYSKYTDKITYTLIGYSVSTSPLTTTLTNDNIYGFSNTSYGNFANTSLTAGLNKYYSNNLINYCKSMFKDKKVKDFIGREYTNEGYPFFGFTIPSEWYNDYVTNFVIQKKGVLIVSLHCVGEGDDIKVEFKKCIMNKPEWMLSDNVDYYIGYIVQGGSWTSHYVIYGYWFRDSATMFAIPLLDKSAESAIFNPLPSETVPFYKIDLKPVISNIDEITYINWINRVKCSGIVKCPSKEFNYTTNETFDSTNLKIYAPSDNLNAIIAEYIKNTYFDSIILYNNDKEPIIVLSPKTPIQKSYKIGYNFNFEIDIFEH